MVKIESLREIQNLALDVLKYVVEKCETNGLRYFLAGGTLLGAVRHSGFIPWDDDIDICMPRDDYERLISLFRYGNESTQYEIVNPMLFDDYYCGFSKIVDTRTIVLNRIQNKIEPHMGIGIDIFPLDGFGNNKKKAINKIMLARSFVSATLAANTGFKGIALRSKAKRLCFLVLCKLFTRKKLIEMVEKRMKTISFDSSKYIGSTYGIKGRKEIIEQKVFLDFQMHAFEDSVFRIPVEFDTYLRQMYGNYSELPPLEERIQSHNYDYYWQ